MQEAAKTEGEMCRLYERLTYYAEHAPNNKAFTYRILDQYESIDYAVLREYVDSLAAELYRGGHRTIAIIGNNKLEYAVALLAVLCHLGDAFLIDKELREEDVERIFEQRKPDLVLLDEELDLAFDGWPVCRFDEVREMMKAGKKWERNDAFSGKLILHTSGTTGRPKCVALKEEQYYGVIPELNGKWGVKAEHSCLFIIPLYHIYALTSLFHGLYAGINNILEWDYKRLGKVLAETKPCLFMGVPLMYNRIKDAVFEKAGKRIKAAIFASNLLLKLGIDIRKKLFSEVYAYFGGNYYFGISAGSPLPYQTSRFFNDIGLPIYNVYGMTETSGPVAINYKGHNRYDSVGEILDVNEVMIKSTKQGEGGVGQVYVKGCNVFDGYLEEEERACFDGPYYDTGDLGYIKDGYLYVVGREKGILIGSNGKNISRQELKDRILGHDQIHDCQVIMEDDHLVAIVNTELGEQELKRYFEKLNRSLPNYKKIADFRVTQKRIK